MKQNEMSKTLEIKVFYVVPDNKIIISTIPLREDFIQYCPETNWCREFIYLGDL